MNVTNLLRRTIASCLIVSFVTVTSACYGPFNLTRNVYHWNSNIKGSGEVNDKWMKEFVFFGMIVVPVYMFSALLDAFVFNSIQFWSGDNPIKVTYDAEGRIKEVRSGETTITVSAPPQGAVEVIYSTNGTVLRRATIIETSGGYRLVDEAGHPLSEVELSSDGGVRWLNGDCQVAGAVSAQQAREMAQNRVAVL